MCSCCLLIEVAMCSWLLFVVRCVLLVVRLPLLLLVLCVSIRCVRFVVCFVVFGVGWFANVCWLLMREFVCD